MKIGDFAPEFKLKNQNSQDISLSDYKDQNILLLFFPFAFSSLCTTEMCSVSDDIRKFESLNSKVIGISVDSHYTLSAFSERFKINFNLLSDFNKEVSRKYDSFEEYFFPEKYNYKGVAKRSAVIIGKDKKIKYHKICADPDEQPDYDEIKKVLEELND